MPANSETGPDAFSETGGVRAPDQQIEVVVERAGDGIVVLHVIGEIDLLTADVLGERLQEQLIPASRALVLDLTAVSFLGSAGLAQIVSASRKVSEGSARILLVADNRSVLRPLEVTGLLSLFAVYATVDAAVQAAAT